MKFRSLYLLLFLASVSIVSCVKDENELLEANGLVISANQEVNENTSTATGSITAKFNKSTNVMNYTVTWSGLSGNHTGIKLYAGARKAVGEVVRTIATSGNPSGSLTENWNVPAEIVSKLEQGLIYVNITTTQYPDGEIRGQIEF